MLKNKKKMQGLVDTRCIIGSLHYSTKRRKAIKGRQVSKEQRVVPCTR